MNSLLDIKSYNAYIGLSEPKNEDIDIGHFVSSKLKLKSKPITLDFFKFSLKLNFIDHSKEETSPYNAIFFNSPNTVISWEVSPSFTGMYLHLSKKYIDNNYVFFKNFLDYGQHKAIYLTSEETTMIKAIFENIYLHSKDSTVINSIINSYVYALISLIQTIYSKQVSKQKEKHNPIVSDFQRLLYNYYNRPVDQIPSVKYFANQLKLSPNYLGDIIKLHTKKSAKSTIQDFVILKAKKLLENESITNNEVAFELGFKHSNYFTKFFKKRTLVSPRSYKISFQKNSILT